MHIRHTIHTEEDLRRRFGLRFLERWRRLLSAYRERFKMNGVNTMRVACVAVAFCGMAEDGNCETGENFDNLMHGYGEVIELDNEPFVVRDDDDCTGMLAWDAACLMLEEREELLPDIQWAFDIAGRHSVMAYKPDVMNVGVTVTKLNVYTAKEINGWGQEHPEQAKTLSQMMSELTLRKCCPDVAKMVAGLNGLNVSTPAMPQQVKQKVEQMTNRQVVIMMTALMGITLTPKYTNQKLLSQMLSKMTGRSAESIRQTIMDIAKDGLETPQAREDMRLAADTIEPFCKDVAMKLRNDAEDV